MVSSRNIKTNFTYNIVMIITNKYLSENIDAANYFYRNRKVMNYGYIGHAICSILNSLTTSFHQFI